MKARQLLMPLIGVLLFSLPANLLADTLIRQATHQDGMMTVPASDDTTTTWMGDGVTRSDAGDQSIIIDTKAGMMYMLNNDEKWYMEIPLEDLGNIEKMIGLDEMDPDQAATVKQQLQAMKGMMQVNLTITPTDETSKIKDWNCKKYLMDMKMGMANVKSEAWVTKDIDADWSDFWKTTNAMMFQMPGAEQVMEEAKKMDGLPVKTVGTAQVMGKEMKMTSEVIEVATKNAPEGTYSLPKDYKKKEYELGAGMKH